jgi:hypothetical protein
MSVDARPDARPIDAAIPDARVPDAPIPDAPSIDAPIPDAPSIDAPIPDAPSIDAPPVDAGCPPIDIIDPTATVSGGGRGWTFVPSWPGGGACWEPGNPQIPVGVFAFQTSAPMQVTMWYRHSLLPDTTYTADAILDACEHPTTYFGTSNYGTNSGIMTRSLPAGSYTLSACDPAFNTYFQIEPPIPAASNTSCATAVNLVNTVVYNELRVLDNNPRYYTYTVWATGQTSFSFSSAMFAGSMRVDVYDSCGGNQVAGFNYDRFSPETLSVPLPLGSHVIVVSAITVGMQYSIGVSP